MNYDPMQPHDREAQAAREAKLAQIEERRAVEDLKWMAAHKPGRRVLWRLLSRTGVFRNPFHTSGSVMAFKSGEQNIGQELLAELMKNSPETFALMMKEAADDERRTQQGDNTQET